MSVVERRPATNITAPTTTGRRRPGFSRWWAPILGVMVIVVLAVLPELQVSIPGVLPGPTSTAGTLQLLAVCLLLGSLAVTYHLLFGVTGLLSFGQALYFAAGCYGLAIALRNWHLTLLPAVLVTLVFGLVISVLLGAISLRVSGIAFAMVTLAFAQAGSLLVYRNLGGQTGGEEGLGLPSTTLPAALLGVGNTANLYWIALAVAVVVYVVVWWVSASRAGAMMTAVRENELRVQVLGVRPYLVRLIAFTVAGTLATVIGMAYLLLQGGANPQITSSNFTLSLLVMVVLGGVGARWGALVGGVVYTLLDQRLGSLASSQTVAALPDVLRIPLSQPLFILGILFVLVVMFLPGGLAGAFRRLIPRAGASSGPRPRARLDEMSFEEAE